MDYKLLITDIPITRLLITSVVIKSCCISLRITN